MVSLIQSGKLNMFFYTVVKKLLYLVTTQGLIKNKIQFISSELIFLASQSVNGGPDWT